MPRKHITTQLNATQYDALERAIADGRRLSVWRRGSEFIVMPARGLTLVEVGYPPDAELAVRAQRTRAKRSAGGLPDEAPID